MTDITFTGALLDFESGISLDHASYYEANWRKPVMTYWKVERPGRCIRNSQGALVPVCLTISEYFSSVGLSDCAPPFSRMDLSDLQYSVVNPLGFVGFQFGERLLWQLGCYEPEQVAMDNLDDYVPRLYIGNLSDEVWKNGNREQLHTDQKLGCVIATDTNEWRGTFTDRFNISGFNSLKSRAVQRKLFRESVRYSFSTLIEHADSYSDKRLLDVVVGKIDGLSVFDSVMVTRSGLAAASHLVGPTAVARFLSEGHTTTDEIGTSVADYLTRFGNTKFDVMLADEA